MASPEDTYSDNPYEENHTATPEDANLEYELEVADGMGKLEAGDSVAHRLLDQLMAHDPDAQD